MYLKSIILIILLNPIFCSAQNYVQYQRTFNSIDEDVLDSQYSKALYKLDTIDKNYQFVYAKHCVKALQISVISNDSIRAQTWLSRCFKQGVPLWFLRENDLTNIALSYSTCLSTISNCDSLINIYNQNINFKLRKTIDSLLVIDQKYTQRMNNGFFILRYSIYYLQWRHYNKKQYKFIRQLINKYGFPDERLIGLPILEDSAKYAKHLHFWGPSEIRNASVQIMLQHCYSTSHKIDTGFINLLKLNQINGYTTAFQVAIINDFMYGRKNINKKYKFLYYPNLTNTLLIHLINNNRYTLGLNTLEQERRNDLIERNRRKNILRDSKIVLE